MKHEWDYKHLFITFDVYDMCLFVSCKNTKRHFINDVRGVWAFLDTLPPSQISCFFLSPTTIILSHIGRKHKIENGNFPRTCDLCDFVIKNEKHFKKHMLSHSYKRIEYKCEECEFYGTDELAMEIHIKKVHSEMIECGLCDSVFEDPDKCELHFQTLNNLKKQLRMSLVTHST